MNSRPLLLLRNWVSDWHFFDFVREQAPWRLLRLSVRHE
jgi:hypothetical protein